MIAHPPCTYLCKAGLHYSKKNPERMKKTMDAFDFFKKLFESNIPKIAVENPVGIISTIYWKPNQIIHPFQFWEAEQKETCLWLKGLPLLEHTSNLEVIPRKVYIRKSGPRKWQIVNSHWRDGKNAHVRSKTFQWIADAMALQWWK